MSATVQPVRGTLEDGSLPVSTGGLNIGAYDYGELDSSGSTTDIWTFKSGGSGGTTVATVTIEYTDATKNTIATFTKS